MKSHPSAFLEEQEVVKGGLQVSTSGGGNFKLVPTGYDSQIVKGLLSRQQHGKDSLGLETWASLPLPDPEIWESRVTFISLNMLYHIFSYLLYKLSYAIPYIIYHILSLLHSSFSYTSLSGFSIKIWLVSQNGEMKPSHLFF